MGYYFIKPKLNPNLCLSVANSTMASGQNVIVYTKTGNYNITQKWFVESLSSNQFVLNASNQAYGLKMTLGNTRNCEIDLTGIRESDSANVDFVSSGDGYYYIKMHTTNWYLCCAGSTTGSNVYWALNPGGTDAQKWSMESTTIPGPSNYTYMVANCAACELHIIRTGGGNLKLKNLLRKTPVQANIIGINAGFFRNLNPDGTPSNSVAVYNIAKCDGSYVGPNPSPDGGQQNGSGCGAGAIYRTAAGSYGFLEVRDALTNSILKNLTGNKSWAQGGAGMYLGDSGWLAKAGINFDNSLQSTGEGGRTALVVDTLKDNAYLIVALNVKYIPFRSAIMEYLNLSDGSAASTRFLGLFLDGGGSSQIRARTPADSLVYLGGPRPLCEVITI